MLGGEGWIEVVSQVGVMRGVNGAGGVMEGGGSAGEGANGAHLLKCGIHYRAPSPMKVK